MGTTDLPDIRFAVPINSENRWSDMLAVLVATDPAPACQLLGLEVPPDEVRVHREVSVGASNRTDLILCAGERRVAVLEVKVLASLGPQQLLRYETAEPDADNYAVVFPERLVVDTRHAPRWQPVTWEALLAAYAKSTHPWVQSCALAWQAHLDTSLPKVDALTRWGDLTEGEGFVVAMRARASWVHSNLDPPSPIEHDLIGSSAGASWPIRLYTAAAAPGYRVMVDVEERMNVRAIPKWARAETHAPLGPVVKVVLLQRDVTTSAGFDWDYLLSMWPVMAAARSDWQQRSATPRHPDDKARHKAMVAKGGPKWLGYGFGERQTKINGECMFGAKFYLPPDITLGDLVATLEETAVLLLQMAQVQLAA